MKRSLADSSKKSSITQTILSNIENTRNKRLAEKGKSKKVKQAKSDKEIDFDYEE